MKTIIAGSRSGISFKAVCEAIKESGFTITQVFCGGAAGADRHGEAWAIDRNIPVRSFIPMWDKHGKKAGILRNIEMAKEAEALIAVWNGYSRGTSHMIVEATERGLKVWVHKVRGYPPCNPSLSSSHHSDNI